MLEKVLGQVLIPSKCIKPVVIKDCMINLLTFGL
jgi:hypothetical protein